MRCPRRVRSRRRLATGDDTVTADEGRDLRHPCRRRSSERLVAVLLAASTLSALGAVATYVKGAHTQLLGVLLAGAFGCLGAALVTWSHRLLPDLTVEEPWPFADSDDHANQEEAAAEALHEDLERSELMGRRPLLRRLLLAAAGAIGLAALVPLRSLGPRPGNALRVTPWRRGRRLVDSEGRPISAAGIPAGGIVTAFPEGHVDAADGVVVLVRTGTSSGRVQPEPPEPRSLEGLFAYSKICTHAGCPVGLYVDERRTLLCPCHQSEFDVVDGARPVSGPAARPLPRLPVALRADGTLEATGDFDEPVGPAWWTR